jgi:hypothetical protein
MRLLNGLHLGAVIRGSGPASAAPRVTSQSPAAGSIRHRGGNVYLEVGDG